MDTTGRTSSSGTPEPEEHARDEHDIHTEASSSSDTDDLAGTHDGSSAEASDDPGAGASLEHDGQDAESAWSPTSDVGHGADEPHDGPADEPTLRVFREEPASRQHISADTGKQPGRAASDGSLSGDRAVEEEEDYPVADEPTMALPPPPRHSAGPRASRSNDYVDDDDDDDATHATHERERRGQDRDDAVNYDDDWPAIYMPSSRPLSPTQQRTLFEAQRRSRRRRRYTLFMRRTARARQAAKSSSITRAAWASVIVMFALIISVLTATVAAAAAYYQSEYSLIKGLQHEVASKDSVRIYDSKGILLYELRGDGAQHSISLANVPITVVNATVAIEDHEFWNNGGVDFISIGRAAITNLQAHGVSQGGSTITQQLIKQQVLQDSSPNFARKLNEAILSLGMTYQGVYTKRQIMELYLNSIPYSPTAYGIDAAAHEYFGYEDDPATGITAAQHLTLAQAAMLAGIPQNPNTNDPLLHPEKAHARMGEVLHAMISYGYITSDQANAAWAESTKPNFYHPTTQEQNKAPHFVYYVLDQLQEMIQTGQLHNFSRSGLSVYTTLDLDMQNHVQAYMKQHLYGDDRDDYRDGNFIRDNHLTNTAGIIVDHHTGALKVLLGSVDYYSTKINGKFDVATQGFRGPGSSFKPIAYATAFEKGWFPAMSISDMPSTFWDDGSQSIYRPLDFSYNEFRGEITLRTALQFSLNIPAIKVMEFAGVDNVKRNAMRMGITRWGDKATWGLSSVLGSLDVRPIDMVQAYTVFANYGQYIPIYGIDKIVDSNSDVLFQYHTPQPIQVMSPQVAYMVTSVLEDNASRAQDFGGCSPLYLDPDTDAARHITTPECDYLYSHNFTSPRAWPAAAKTGTGQNFTDDWTMGYTMDYTMGVWAGNNDYTPMYHISGVTGAAPTWYRSMLYAEHNLPKREFPAPPTGMHRAHYCSDGVCTTDWFLDGPTPPDNLGENGPTSVPCINFLDTGGWEYASSGHCDETFYHPIHY